MVFFKSICTVNVLDCRHVYHKSCCKWALAGVLFLVTHPCTALSGPHCPGYSSPAAGLPNVAFIWAGDDQVCWQNTLCILSLTKKAAWAEPWHKLQQRVKDMPYLHRGAIEGETVTSPLNSWTAFLIKQIQSCFLWCTERVEQSTGREH